ncbi:protein of unknown function [Methylococcus capsulatus]|uniref:Uncharacterized protein n=1 Tax=Methylococcus capsulatus TaxID=414 RepID=A0AA35XV04_METCP|nr:protein of unknown function [Methylococcus capsulatus]
MNPCKIRRERPPGKSIHVWSPMELQKALWGAEIGRTANGVAFFPGRRSPSLWAQSLRNSG